MGIAKTQFDTILKNIFAAGNIIKLLKTVPTVSNENGYVLLSTSDKDEYARYEIESGDFTTDGGEVTSTKNMLFGLYEGEAELTVPGFAVFSGSTLMYYGNFKDPMIIKYNNVPIIKAYNESKSEGIKITMTSTEAAASAE